MTVYLFDKWQRVRKIIPWDDVYELIHDEGNYSLEAEVPAALMVMPGEYLGFGCVDGLFRLFEVVGANYDDDRNIIVIKATDAAAIDLKGEIIEDVQQIDVGLREAIGTLLPGWEITGDEPDRVEKSRAYYATAWAMLQTFAELYEWRIIPHYEFADGAISRKVIALKPAEPVFRGRILQNSRNAKRIYVSNTNKPITRLYGLGPAQGTTDLQTNMTFADVEWSRANGDPADKPKGQTWVADTEVEAREPVYAAIVSITDAEDETDLLQKTWDKLHTLTATSVKADADVADMEMLPGHSHEQIRLGDLAAVKLRIGITVEAKIIGIKRNYKYKGLTKISLGDRRDTIQAQVSTLIGDATHTFERLTIYQNRFEDDEELIQLNATVVQENAEHIQRNAESIIDNADWIEQLAEKIQLQGQKVTENGERIDTAYLEIDGVKDSITAQAETIRLQGVKVDDNGDRIDTAYLEIDGVKDSITAQAETIRLQGVKVDDNGERIDTAFVEIDGANDRIDAQADEIYLQAEKLEAQADEISLQAETLKIKADVDLLDAYVKANELEAFILYVAGSGRINDLIANTLTATSSVVAETGRFDTSLYGMAMECSMLTVNDSIGMGGQWYGGLALNLLTGTTPWIETATKTISFLTPYNDEETVKVVTGVYLHGITSVPVGLIGYEA